jgi:glycosyltransferase involved in cell wall biosynthesis
MRILLLSAYHADSHRQWCRGLMAYLSQHDWTLLSLPARHFAWRVRGNSLSWAFSQQQQLGARYDLVVATSLVDLAALRGFVPSLAQIPTLVYFHENQFAYPQSDHQRPAVEPRIVNLYSALCADQVVFNSAWNRDSFLGGAEALFDQLPDHVPSGLGKRLAGRSTIVPVGLDPTLFAIEREKCDHREAPRVLWNHRWEYDKGPDALLGALRELKRRQLPFRLDLLGQQFRQQPAAFEQIRQEFAAELDEFGYLPDRSAYVDCLTRADLVLSTALHDFQGLAVLEASACGALPLVPARLAYPEFLPETCLYPSTPEQPEIEARALVDAFIRLTDESGRQATRNQISLRDLGWDRLSGRYDDLFRKLAGD